MPNLLKAFYQMSVKDNFHSRILTVLLTETHVEITMESHDKNNLRTPVYQSWWAISPIILTPLNMYIHGYFMVTTQLVTQQQGVDTLSQGILNYFTRPSFRCVIGEMLYELIFGTYHDPTGVGGVTSTGTSYVTSELCVCCDLCKYVCISKTQLKQSKPARNISKVLYFTFLLKNIVKMYPIEDFSQN